MVLKGRLLWLRILIIPCLALFVFQCGGSDDDPVVPAAPVYLISALEGGIYSFEVSSIFLSECYNQATLNYLNTALNAEIQSFLPALIELPDGDEVEWPYDIAGPYNEIPLVGTITGTISENTSNGALDVNIIQDPLDPLTLTIDLGPDGQGLCEEGTLVMEISVNKAGIYPTANKVTARINASIDSVTCNNCTCSWIITSILNSAETPCNVAVLMTGTLLQD